MMMLQRISPHTFVNTTQISSSPGSPPPPTMTNLVEQPESSPPSSLHHHPIAIIKRSLSPVSPHMMNERYHHHQSHNHHTSSRPSTPNSERDEPIQHDLTIVKRRISQDSEIEMRNPDEEDDHDSRDLRYHHYEKQVISVGHYQDRHDEIDRRHGNIEVYGRRDVDEDDDVPLDLSINSAEHRRPHYQYSHHRIQDDHRQNHDSGTDSDDSGGPGGEDRGPGTAAYKKSLMKRYCKLNFKFLFF